MSTEFRASENPSKWRYTWEALSHIPTLRLFLFNPYTNPKNQCKNLKIDLNLEESLVMVSWLEDTEVLLRVPIPRVLVDVESPLAFRALDDHIEVKLVLLLPVDHPIISNFDSVLKLSEDGCCNDNALSDFSQPLSLDSDLKSLSSGEGVHFYCRSCSTKLTRSPLRHFVEMPSVNWREVADNWFGACCCSFGGVSEKLVTKYTNSYSCVEGTCLLNASSIIFCKDDLLGWKFPDWDGRPNNEFKIDFVGGDDSTETTLESGNDRARMVCCENQNETTPDFDGKNSIIHPRKDNLAMNQQCEFIRKEIDGDSLLCRYSVLDFSENLASAPPYCVDTTCNVRNHDNVDCSHDVSVTTELPANQKSFLNGLLGNVFMVGSSHLSKDVKWVDFKCTQCSSLLGAYPCGDGHTPLDGGVRLFKCYISTCLPVGGSDDMFRAYTLERMFTNQLVESAKDELSFRTVVRDLRTKSPLLQIVLLNPNSWCCSDYCWGTEGAMEPVSKINLCPVIKVLFSDCSNNTDSQLRTTEEWVTKNRADEVYMLMHLIKELIESLKSAKDIFPPSYAFLQGLALSSMQR